MKNKSALIMTCVFLVAVILSACGGGGSSTTGSTPPASSTAQTSSTAPAENNGAGQGDAAPADEKPTFHMISANAGSKETQFYYGAMEELLAKTFPDGEVTLEVFHNGELTGSNKEQLEMVRAHLIQWQSVPPFEFFTQSPNMSMFLFYDLPFVFDTHQQLFDFSDSDFSRDNMYKAAEQELGVRPVGVYSMGFVHVGSNKQPITDAASIKNQKIRTLLSEVYVETVKSWGAAPTSLEWPEVYTAMQQGAIDGLTSSAPLLTASLQYEVTKYYADVGCIDFSHIAFYDLEFWNSLPEEYKTKLDEMQPEVNDRGRKNTLAYEEEALEIIRTNCEMTVLTPEQRLTFSEPAKAVWESKADLIGREFLENALKEVGKALS